VPFPVEPILAPAPVAAPAPGFTLCGEPVVCAALALLIIGALVGGRDHDAPPKVVVPPPIDPPLDPEPNPDNIYHLDRAKFGNEVEPKVGTIILFDQPNGSELPGIIRAVEGMSVTVDFNHPLAGHTVTFEVEILGVDDEEKVH
jgi:hypothetical protein